MKNHSKTHIAQHIAVLMLALVYAEIAVAGKKPQAVITGKEMRMTQNGSVVVFNGAAKVVQEKNTLFADTIVQDKEKNDIEASGNIRFEGQTEKGEPIRAYAQKARYNLDSGNGQLYDGRQKVVYSLQGSTVPVVLRSDTISFSKQLSEIETRGNVEVVSSTVSAYAPLALFYQQENKMLLRGSSETQARLIYHGKSRSDRFWADDVTLLFDKRKIILQGKVKGFVVKPEEKR